MNIFKLKIIHIIGICIISFLPMTTVWSADEDMISQVYLEFDPETGEFVTAQDPNLTGTSKHSAAQSKQVQEIQNQQDQLAGQDQAGSPATNTAAAPAQQQSSAMDGDGAGSSSTMLIAIVAGLLIVGGIFVFMRKGSQSA